MPKRMIPILIIICLVYGCGDASGKKSTPIKIDNINITSDEYNEAFKNSPYATADTAESRKEFLDTFVSRVLILREAEKTGMDKDPEFLKNVQLFWQQSLVKMMLDKKIKEFSSHVRVDDSEVRGYYQANKDSEFNGRELSDVYHQIKWIILNKKQEALLNDWINSLRINAKIEIDEKLTHGDK